MSEAKENPATRLPMITTARIGFPKAAIQKMVLADTEAEFDLFHVVGSISQQQVKEAQDDMKNDSIEFRGSFMAINAETGEQFKSGKLYLPSIVEAEIAAAVQRNGLVEIALTVTASYAEKSATSYTYNVKSYGKEDNTAFEGLLALIPGIGTKALPAPTSGKKEVAKAGKGGKKGK